MSLESKIVLGIGIALVALQTYLLVSGGRINFLITIAIVVLALVNHRLWQRDQARHTASEEASSSPPQTDSPQAP